MQWFVDNPEQLPALKRDARRFAEEKLTRAQKASGPPEFFAPVRKGNSHSLDMRRQVSEMLGGEELDYLFTDADHSYERVRSDFEMYRAMVRKGGLIAFHDIAGGPPNIVGGVPRFWGEVKSGYRCKELIENRKQGWGGIGLLFIE